MAPVTKKKELRVIIFSLHNATKYGHARDAQILEQVLKEKSLKADAYSLAVLHLDPRTAQIPWADIAFHLEAPCRLALPYARKHFFLMNPEWWYTDEWRWVAEFCAPSKDKQAEGTLLCRYPLDAGISCPVMTLDWRSVPPPTSTDFGKKRLRQTVCFLGGSQMKIRAAAQILPLWRAEWPPLHVWGSSEAIQKLQSGGQIIAENVHLHGEHVSEKDMWDSLAESEFVLLPSAAEGFGYAMMEAATAGCVPIWSAIPAYGHFLGPVIGSFGSIPTRLAKEQEAGILAECREIESEASFVSAADNVFSLTEEDSSRIRRSLMAAVAQRTLIFREQFQKVWQMMVSTLSKTPIKPGYGEAPRILTEGIPRVGVVTLTYNRPHWMRLAFRNILEQNWPQERMVWAIVDDGDWDKRVDDQVIRFQERNPKLTVDYISIPKKQPIGAKRNRAVKQLLAKYPDIEYFVMMDDDDVYFRNSIRDRIAWIQSRRVAASYSAILPMYDLNTYTSAINVPPLTLGPAKRVSEASLAFTAAFWRSRPFPAEAKMAEGEGFLTGRETETVEISPQGILVSLLHSQNTSSRTVRSAENDKNKENGCHYGFSDDFFVFLHELGEKAASVPKAGDGVMTTSASAAATATAANSSVKAPVAPSVVEPLLEVAPEEQAKLQ